MYLKQLTIQGFKSYAAQTIIEPFSPQHNVIVGRNGSGKSNFFAAIRFVLSDAYTQMSRDERQGLLHEGSGSAVMSAYVEIIFDNSEDRFPTGKPETIIRRTIGLKKDEYSLDRKNATKSDVMNLLESAGFSRSNPYYIVPQGRVTSLTNMKDSERLNLLKEVAGTQVYEQRRSESLKIMDETNAKRGKIDELLKYIEDRLNELEEEKEELRGFQEKDRERRCLEYTIYHREQQELSIQLDQIEEARVKGAEFNEESREALAEREQQIRDLQQRVKRLKNDIDLQTSERKQLEDEVREHVRTKAQLELQLKSLSDNQSNVQDAKRQYEEELAAVNEEIENVNTQLMEIRPAYSDKRAEETQLQQQLNEAKSTRQRLLAKQGRGSTFKNKKERDDWIKKELQDNTAIGKKAEANKKSLQKEIADTEKQIASLESEIASIREQFGGRSEAISAINDSISKLREQRSKLSDERKELWREDSTSESKFTATKEELNRAQHDVNTSMDHQTRNGLEAIRRYKQEQRIEGLYGTLAELCEVEERYRTAVEVSAGNSLFHYVVDNDETASKALDYLQSLNKNSGRVTFMPLNRLRNRRANLPESNDAIPMIRKIKFDKRYENAFEHVFGNTIICPDLTVAAQYARSHGVTAITLAGDRSDKRGALTGGYHDPRRSRLESVKSLKRVREEFEERQARNAELKQLIQQKDQEITQVNGQIAREEQRRQQTEESYGPMKQLLSTKSQQLSNLKDNLDAKHRSMENVEETLRNYEAQQDSYQSEMKSEFKKSLSKEEEAALESAVSAAQDIQRKLGAIAEERADLEQQKLSLEAKLEKNLLPRLDELKSQDGDVAQGRGKDNTKELQRDLKKTDKKLAEVQKRLAQAKAEFEAGTKELKELEKQKAEIEEEQAEVNANIQRQQKRMERNISKKSLLAEKAAECSRNIRELGVLPEEAFSKFEKTSSQAILKRLHKVHEALKKFSHVNKKAVEQYNNFTKQRESLIKRREELDKSQSSIEELIQVLDTRKDEAIERTFRQVSKSFAEIFEKLVPAGRGRLVIQRKVDKNRNDGESSEDEAPRDKRSAVENYTGVGISVSFNSKHNEQQHTQQLSGGQKSLCALALVFAIQNCDPAPFYLFDEVDANLDSQYRSAVAQMIKENSANNVQYICTTFRPELIMTANKHYGVTYTKKTSSVDIVTKEQALQFVEEEVAK